MYTQPLARLIEEFQKFPGVGPKSAQRMAFYMLKWQQEQVNQFAQAMTEAKALIHPCPICYHLTAEINACEICTSPTRDKSTLIVVADVGDVIALENTHQFRGLYHVLQGLVSPMEGIGPDQLTISALKSRLTQPDNGFKEIIFALPPSVEGDTTTLYLTQALQGLGLLQSRIAFGLPVGGELEYADAMTLGRALSGRTAVA
jgi:recombination protein RecR